MSAERGPREVVVITGASSGVGRATAQAFAREGARIGLIARGRESLARTLDEVGSLGGEGIALPLDVSEAGAVDEAASRVEEKLGPIDVWVNNAMVSMMSPLEEMTAEEFERITKVTYLGYVWGTKAALKRMRPRNRGVIVQVGSALAHRSIPLQSAYCGAKHAIVGFTESLRCELIQQQSAIAITVVSLPGMNTPQFNWVRSNMPRKSKPVGTIFQPEVAAEAIVWATRHPRKEVLVGLPTVESVFGNRVIPSLLDRYLAGKVYREHFSDEPESSSRPDNLFRPVPADYGARGPYSAEAKEQSLEFELSKRRGWIASFALVAAGLFLMSRGFGRPGMGS
jgi:NAD(P)-dependent dehydrogenase (short-subunit alcohol dehydrogenase family)